MNNTLIRRSAMLISGILAAVTLAACSTTSYNAVSYTQKATSSVNGKPIKMGNIVPPTTWGCKNIADTTISLTGMSAARIIRHDDLEYTIYEANNYAKTNSIDANYIYLNIDTDRIVFGFPTNFSRKSTIVYYQCANVVG